MRLSGLLIALALVATSAGCGSVSTYFRSRAADLADTIPMSVAHGWGIGASVKATPLVQVGLAASPVIARRYGYDDRTFCGTWVEFQLGLPWSIWTADLSTIPERPYGTPWTETSLPLMYRWQALRHAPTGEGNHTTTWYEPNVRSWGRHPPIARESVGALIWPERRLWLDFVDLRREQDLESLESVGTPDRATLWETRRSGRPAPLAWDLIEVDLFLGFLGARVGLRPAEGVDFLLGIVGIDLMGDDLPAPSATSGDLELASQAEPPGPG